MTWEPGESGNPNGRPPGSENKLTRRAKYYAEKLFDEFEKRGIDNLTKDGDIKDLLQLIKTCLPKEIKGDIEHKVTHTQPISIKFEK